MERVNFPDPTAVTRFWLSVDRRGPDECWPWTGYAEKGYGRFFDGTRMVGAHELAVRWTTGEVRLPDMDTCHSCDAPLCCNPAHLRYGSRQSNVDDMTRSNRQARGERNGHAVLTAEIVLEARHRAAAGATAKTLASEYGVTPSLMSMVLRGTRWPHVGGPLRAAHGNTKHGRYAHG